MPSHKFMIKLMDRVATYAWAGHESDLESFRHGQIATKDWLVYEINKFGTDFKKVAVLGSWDGILLYELMSWHGKIEHWDFYDLNQNCHKRRDKYFDINGIAPNYNSHTMDVTEIFNDEKFCSQYDLIINPSAEHMVDIPAQKGPMYALTSNNYNEIKEHINTIEDYRDLALKNNINKVLYEGELKLPLYTRYCTVGYHDNDR